MMFIAEMHKKLRRMPIRRFTVEELLVVRERFLLSQEYQMIEKTWKRINNGQAPEHGRINSMTPFEKRDWLRKQMAVHFTVEEISLLLRHMLHGDELKRIERLYDKIRMNFVCDEDSNERGREEDSGSESNLCDSVSIWG